MTEPVDTRLIATHLSAALISSGAEMTGHPVADAVRIYFESIASIERDGKAGSDSADGKAYRLPR